MDGGRDMEQKQGVVRTQVRSMQSSKPDNLIDLCSASSSSTSSSTSCNLFDADVLSSASSGEDRSALDSLNNKRPRVPNGEKEENSNKKHKKKKKKKMDLLSVLPADFLEPLPKKSAKAGQDTSASRVQPCKQFWKAGEYEGTRSVDMDCTSEGMDHARVHPKFLHSNATSHKWVLGAFAELLDNSLDEVTNGATFVNIDMVINRKDSSRMILVEDNGGGMDPDKVRQCMSLGYSHKSNKADTIGQYGNGFKTSTMRLGADVIVFSRSRGQEGKKPTQSIGLLSYTFLKSTGKEDIVVPMLDYQQEGKKWERMTRSSTADWHKKLETIIRWSPFASEEDLLRQFCRMKDHGTCIIIYNLWEDDPGTLELDFDADPHDIQIRGVNRDEKNIQMGKQFPNSKHFLTYRHSLRSYASILYLRVPHAFRIILRGRDVEHHNIVNDLMMTQEITYRPNPVTDGLQKDSNMVAVVTIGFVKDAKAHIDVQGFNVYHKNRLIKPFWRLWNPAGSGGRGVIGVLEANFVEPAHDKQGFERTTVLSRLEARLIQMQKTYWSTNSHKIGYASRNKDDKDGRESSPEYNPGTSSGRRKVSKKSEVSGKMSTNDKGEAHMPKKGSNSLHRQLRRSRERLNLLPPPSLASSQHEVDSDDIIPVNENALIIHVPDVENIMPIAAVPLGSDSSPTVRSTPSFGNREACTVRSPLSFGNKEADQECESKVIPTPVTVPEQENGALKQLREENIQMKKSLKRKEDEILGDFLRDMQLEKDKCKDLEAKLEEAKAKIEEMTQDQESIFEVFSKERERRDKEEEKLRNKLKDASNTIQELLDKIKKLEEHRQVTRNGDQNGSRK